MADCFACAFPVFSEVSLRPSLNLFVKIEAKLNVGSCKGMNSALLRLCLRLFLPTKQIKERGELGNKALIFPSVH